MNNSLSILLATYNGERYIVEQIESLLSQTIQDFKLFICDDRSTDATFSIISEYSKQYPKRIFVSQNRENTGGAKYNFFKMMIEHKDEYVMLCDQDDIWAPDKIEKSIDKIRELESVQGKDTPLLVHTDLCVVDKDLNNISSSYEKMASTSFQRKALRQLLTMNIAAGCTEIYNRSLADLIIEEPGFFVVHDWWMSLMASAFGKIGTLYEPTILYRQHGNNNIGAKKVLSFKYIYNRLAHFDKMTQDVENTYRQAESFLRLFSDKLTDNQRELLSAYSSIPRMSRIKKLCTVFKYNFFMHGLPRKAAQIMILLSKGRVR